MKFKTSIRRNAKSAQYVATLAMVGAIGIGAFAAEVYAHKGATGIVKERMDDMEDLAAQMKVLGAMARGRTTYDAKRAEQAARVIGKHAKELPAKFPKGSGGEMSQAKPEVWSKRAEFDQLFAELAKHAEELEAATKAGASSSDAAGKIFRDIARNCGVCHKVYRKPKK